MELLHFLAFDTAESGGPHFRLHCSGQKMLRQKSGFFSSEFGPRILSNPKTKGFISNDRQFFTLPTIQQIDRKGGGGRRREAV